ncbi:hypothetical protein M9H77_12344 [Catharanthus roseus]|uniref:Uncharacterized protein n=1 Tax=Catharanthus roseus TaxID=4058 RepID=A0ACC0BH58_CATRO|nr:hypothetical protein M9H77_12344 [Catharanthus roseus]
MQGQNTVEEVLCLSAQRGYTVFYRNCDEGNVLSDIVVAHSTSIQMMRTWSYADSSVLSGYMKGVTMSRTTEGDGLDRLYATWKSVRIRYPWIRATDKPRHVIMCVSTGGMAGTLVQVFVSRCDSASSHKASINMFLTTYILLFTGL